MSNDFFGIGGYSSFGSSSFMDSYFGASSGGSSVSSMSSMLGDLSMIKSGMYKKALKSYYATQKTQAADSSNSDKESISKSGTADSNNTLSSVKSSAKKLSESAQKLQNIKYDSISREDLLEDVKKFVSDYNETLSVSKNLNSYSMLQTAVWATDQMNTAEGMLNKIGISIKEDNTLAIDEEKFNKALTSDFKGLFAGYGSLASRIGQKASTLYNQSANQMAVNQGKFAYTRNGTLL